MGSPKACRALSVYNHMSRYIDAGAYNKWRGNHPLFRGCPAKLKVSIISR